MNQTRLASTWALLLGLFLLAEGIWGLFDTTVFKVLTTNTTHAVIHIALGLIGIYLASRSRAGGYLIFVGLVLLIVGALWFVEGPKELIVEYLNVNKEVAYVNIVLGVISLIIGLMARRR